MPKLSEMNGNIRGAPPPDTGSTHDEPSKVMSDLVAGFFRRSAFSNQALLCRSLAHAPCDPQEGYASIQGDDPKTAPIPGVSCIADSGINVFVESNFAERAIKRGGVYRQMIARAHINLNVMGHPASADVLRLPVNSRPDHALTFKERPPLSVVQEPDGTTEPNGDALCSD
jgi:hypothetical protein